MLPNFSCALKDEGKGNSLPSLLLSSLISELASVISNSPQQRDPQRIEFAGHCQTWSDREPTAPLADEQSQLPCKRQKKS